MLKLDINLKTSALVQCAYLIWCVVTRIVVSQRGGSAAIFTPKVESVIHTSDMNRFGLSFYVIQPLWALM